VSEPESPESQPDVQPAMEVRSLWYAYKRQLALSGVTFAVAERAIHAFVGPNGAGKTTTLKILATLLKPRHGSARIFGLDVIRQYKEVRRRIGFMPDHFSMYRQMTVFEYLDFFAAAYGQPLEERNTTIRDVLELTDMNKRRDDLIKNLSRGMQQRLALARLLVHDPDLLLLDEPASGLDPRARIELMEILRELRRMGKTIFISSHILAELADLCDSVTIIDRGKIRYSGPMDGLTDDAAETRSYLLALKELHPHVEAALGAIDAVQSVGPLEHTTGYRIVFSPDGLDTNDILEAVIAAGGQVVAFQEDTRLLDRAFMNLTTPGVPT
jgi:ABC-2 type transport system ATP-binding protein